MKKLVALFFLCGILVFAASTKVVAQTVTTIPLTNSATSGADLATAAAEATGSGSIGSPSAQVEQRIKEKIDQDITELSGKQKSRLTAFLDANPPGPLSWNNFIEHAIRYAITEGVQPNIIVLVLLFPLIASLIAASRHVIGLRGFGIYIPAVLSVALVSTGVVEGLLIFLAIVSTALIAKRVVKRSHLAYLPRTALLLWTVSLAIFAMILLAPVFNLVTLMSVNIFPILILVLLAENFLDAQARTKQSEALALTLETIGLAVLAGFIIKWEPMQQFALVEPELLIVVIGLIDLVIGKFVGLRLSERLRFRALIEEE